MSAPTLRPPPEATAPGTPPDPREPVIRLLRDLSSRPAGLSEREAVRRLERYGPNSLVARTTRTWLVMHWHRWRTRHQTRARASHYRTRAARAHSP